MKKKAIKFSITTPPLKKGVSWIFDELSHESGRLLRSFLTRNNVCITLLSLLLLSFSGEVIAQPQPGDVFREYHWLPSQVVEGESFLRVGGKLDYTINTGHFPAETHQGGFIPLPQSIDLKDAVKAEVVVEKVLSHEGTRGLAIQVNEGDWLTLPEADSIPTPAYDYMHHFNPTVEMPLDYLKEGKENTFRFKVDSTQNWGWPQNLLYGVTFRIYYNQASPFAAEPSPVQATPSENGLRFSLNVENQEEIKQVDYIGYYEDADWEGNGQYRQWHAHLHRGQLICHIGSSSSAPFTVDWNTNWLPNQPEPMQVYARITTKDGLIYATSALESLELPMRDFSVELYKPQDVPAQWVTRSGEFSETISISEDIQQATDYQLIWISWSPCYSNGILFNDHLVYSREDPCYDAMLHVITQEDTHVLQAGKNTITTLKTPLFQGQMVHGMEVQWPGIMVKVRFDTPQK
ncbi:hypothetical protein [Tunicatimonas pelagia]|uniref:hypothetical protein n=1 Tax=Tunicatimonas pelagia TaxID=931531 RepID=UPI002664FFD3|nr:hypothetical protein [Tunicatimonas pelagia]WKN43625.1 hypothetical protein P0M28_01410 [Tunicatimonas pelagia]